VADLATLSVVDLLKYCYKYPIESGRVKIGGKTNANETGTIRLRIAAQDLQ
jgi:hypothetical protein